MKKISIGVDNGLNGAVVCVNEDFKLKYWFDTPIIDPKGKGKRQFAVGQMDYMLVNMVESCMADGYDRGKITVWIEKAQPMPKQGVSSTFSIGVGYGLWQGICVGLCLKFEIVHPRTWQKSMLRDVPGKNTKARSMLKCQQVFPDLSLVKPRGRVLSMDGRADAALIAAYGMKQMRGM